MQKNPIMMLLPSGMQIKMNVDAVILAGGASRRMGVTCKAALLLGNETLLDHVVKRVLPQVHHLCVSGSSDVLPETEFAILEDVGVKYQGPLAGLYSALMRPQLSSADYLLISPCDGPFIPKNLVEELYSQIKASDFDVAVVRYEGFVQPTFSLWHKRTIDQVRDSLLLDRSGGFKPLLSELSTKYVDWPEEVLNPFFNINTPADLAFAKDTLCL